MLLPPKTMVLNRVLCITLSGVWELERSWTRAAQGEDTLKADLELWPVGAEQTD